MAKRSRGRRRTNSSIKAFYGKHKLLASKFSPATLKLTLQGFGKRGGVTLRLEKLRRKVPKQNRTAQRKTRRLIGDYEIR
jgi:hypothetical protein